MPEPLIDIRGLKTYFHTEDEVVKAVDDLSISIERGHTLGLVGESGSGKSVTSLTIMRLLPRVAARIEGGSISFLGRDLVKMPRGQMQDIRGSEISMIFQEPGTSLNPVYRAGAQVMEAIRLHEDVSQAEARDRTIELFREVGIPDPERRIRSYPYEMSGGQKQRVMIAMALSCNPKLLIADEPTTALDVTIQAQILDLIRKLRDERGMAILFITHDLGVIGEIADDVAVMFRGKLVEHNSIEEIFSNPRHPYTRGLLACRPKLESAYKRLPTVADFMEVKKAPRSDDGKPLVDRPCPMCGKDIEVTAVRCLHCGEIVDPLGGVLFGNEMVVEKPMTDERMRDLIAHGRGRLLHPKSELEAIGHPWEEGHHEPDTTTVPEGTEPILSLRDLEVFYKIKIRDTSATPWNWRSIWNFCKQPIGPILRAVSNPVQTSRNAANSFRCTFFRKKDYVRAVDGVSFNVYRGQTLGLVGESGCGKTTAGRAILRLQPINDGTVVFDGNELTTMSVGDLRELRRRIQIIFQDPYASLNPRMTVEAMLLEAMRVHNLGGTRRQRRDRAASLLTEVGLLPEHLGRYPHEFSGGQRQRICIARALAVEPEFIICDESVSALDVSVQAQVLNLLKDLQEERGLTYIFISHDLSVVKFMSDMMAVMNEGKIVEFGPSENIYANPKEAYTQRLISAIPNDSLENIQKRVQQRKQTRGGK